MGYHHRVDGDFWKIQNFISFAKFSHLSSDEGGQRVSTCDLSYHSRENYQRGRVLFLIQNEAMNKKFKVEWS